MTKRWRLVSIACACAVALAGPTAFAQKRPKKLDKTEKVDKTPKPAEPDPATLTEGGRLKAAGDVLMDQDRYADALALYEKAYEKEHDPALLYNQGRALEALGDYPAALDKLEAFEQQASPTLKARATGLHDLITSIRARIATVIVRTNAPGARVLVREKAVGVVNGGEMRVRIRAGSASIEVTADEHEPFRREVDLSAGAELVVDARLVRKKRDALVVVRTSPAAADVLFDGKPIGRAPLELRTGAGEHELVATASGYYEERVAMTLALGDKRDVDVEMRKTPGITSKWWFWTAIGVVVAGGVATTIALTTEKSPRSGTFDPGKVAVP